MFQICVADQKVKEKKSTLLSRKFSYAMIKNIKIHNIIDIIEISKFMKPNKCTH